jgi:hypothetical protein
MAKERACAETSPHQCWRSISSARWHVASCFRTRARGAPRMRPLGWQRSSSRRTASASGDMYSPLLSQRKCPPTVPGARTPAPRRALFVGYPARVFISFDCVFTLGVWIRFASLVGVTEAGWRRRPRGRTAAPSYRLGMRRDSSGVAPNRPPSPRVSPALRSRPPDRSAPSCRSW